MSGQPKHSEIKASSPMTKALDSRTFGQKMSKFLENTDRYIQEVNPGGHYKEIWLRDASYILKDQFISSAEKPRELLSIVNRIWSYQITRQSRKKVIHGRGSPEMKFKSKPITKDEKSDFEGALPSTIYYRNKVSEIYAKNPDIDSTALTISATAWILGNMVKDDGMPFGLIKQPENKEKNRIDEAIDFTVPRMLKAIDYLVSRDIDTDGLLEQDHNEDWMDTVMRRGKIVYSQACFILALKHLSFLFTQIETKNESYKMIQLANNTTKAVEKKLWSEEERSYIDVQQEEKHIGGPYRTLTQDVSLYLIAVTEDDNTSRNSLFRGRAQHTLDALQRRIWKEKWPLVTEVELKKTGPWKLKPNQYHNHTFWPWSTGIEMLARSRFNQFEECELLFSKLSSDDHPHRHIFYEWVNPTNDQANGAYPFRTGVSAVRIAAREIVSKIIENKPQRRGRRIQL
jgi:hypothetical protein